MGIERVSLYRNNLSLSSLLLKEAEAKKALPFRILATYRLVARWQTL